MFGLLAILNGIIVWYILKELCKGFFGDSPWSRLLRVVVSLIGGFGYFLFCAIVNDSTDISIFWGSLVIFGPVVIAILLLLIGYMFNK